MALISMCLGNTLHINVYVFSVPYVINVKLPPTGTLTLMAKQTMTLMGSKSLTLMSLVRALQHRGGAGALRYPHSGSLPHTRCPNQLSGLPLALQNWPRTLGAHSCTVLRVPRQCPPCTTTVPPAAKWGDLIDTNVMLKFDINVITKPTPY